MAHTKSVIVMVIVSGCLRHAYGYQEDRIIFRNEDNSNNKAERLSANGCITPNGAKGECISILQCPALLAMIGNRNQHEFLRQARCGWNRDSPLVCCGNEFSTTTIRTCTAAELHWCRSDIVDVCCIPELTYNIQVPTTITTQTRMNRHCEISSTPSNPPSKCCGQEVNVQGIIPGEITHINQYPWTAVIEYAGIRTDIQLMCGGALISVKYVLTAAHCLYIENWTPVNVRLGDYDIDHPGVDCVKEPGGEEEYCTDGAVMIPIEETVSHPDYSVESRMQIDDIALIRLQHSAPHTDFIHSICLPSATDDFTETAETSTRLRVAGWGLQREGKTHSQLRRQVDLQFVSAEACFMTYRRMNVVLGDGQICAGGEKKQNSCKGDSGGALMLVRNQTTEIVGIASFSSCGRMNRPAVFTKVHYYLPWIRSNIH